jgi:hypothetical protein
MPKERHMRLVIALAATLAVVVASQVAIAAVFAQGEAVVTIAASDGELAREWDIDLTGGTASTNHITLAPVAVGLQGDVTIAVAGSKATLTSTTVLPADRALSSVGCLDDQTPPTEISPVVDGSAFALEVVAGRRYRCFVASLPVGVADPAAPAAADPAAPAAAVPAPTHTALPRSDSVAAPSTAPGWLIVLVVLVAILGVAAVLRPARR